LEVTTGGAGSANRRRPAARDAPSRRSSHRLPRLRHPRLEGAVPATGGDGEHALNSDRKEHIRDAGPRPRELTSRWHRAPSSSGTGDPPAATWGLSGSVGAHPTVARGSIRRRREARWAAACGGTGEQRWLCDLAGVGGRGREEKMR
jgi:hypothetical protein